MITISLGKLSDVFFTLKLVYGSCDVAAYCLQHVGISGFSYYSSVVVRISDLQQIVINNIFFIISSVCVAAERSYTA